MSYAIDVNLLLWLNQFAGQFPHFDAWIGILSSLALLKGCLFVAVLWTLWFDAEAQRSRVAATLLGALCAFFLARIFSHALPFRLRPLHDPEIPFHLPYGMDPTASQIWSSFPSDHAAIFMALATGIFMISRWLGGLAIAYALIAIFLPRLYLGLHFLSDIAGGAMLGLLTVWLFNSPVLRERIGLLADWAESRFRSGFYGLAFLGSYLLATMADDLRRIYGFLVH